MAVNLSPIGGVAGQFFTNNGTPLSGGKIYTYAAGSSTPAATYTSSAGGTAHTNPIVLDSGGRVPTGEIWLTDGVSYKFVIKTSADVLIGTYDNIVGINSNFVNYTNSQEIQTATAGQTLFTLTGMAYAPGTNSLSVFVDGVNQYGPGAQYAYVETSSTEVTFVNGLHVGAEVKFTTSQLNSSAGGDASQVSYTPAGTGAVTTNVQAKLRQTVSVMDFGADPTGLTDSTDAIKNSIYSGKRLYAPAGTYLITDTLDVPYGLNLYGDGIGRTTFNFSANDKSLFYFAGNDNCTFNGLSFISTNGQDSVTDEVCFDFFSSTGLSERNINITECFFSGFSICGIYLSSQWNITTNNCVFENCGRINPSVGDYTGGIVFKQDGTLSGWSGSGNSFNDSYFGNCSYAIYNEAGWNVNVNNCILEYNNYPYFKSDNGSAMVLNNCWLEGNTNQPVVRGPVIIISGNNEPQIGDVNIASTSDAMILITGKGVQMLRQSGVDLVNIAPNGSVYTAIGVGFPATQVLNSNPNVLDDYEEGSWTPTLTGFTGTGLTTSGSYTKIGNQITFSVIISGTNLTSVAGTSCFNLPITVGGNGSVASIVNRSVSGPGYENGLVNFVDSKVYTSSFGPVSSVLISGSYFG